jgi:hypothetical protein
MPAMTVRLIASEEVLPLLLSSGCLPACLGTGVQLEAAREQGR